MSPENFLIRVPKLLVGVQVKSREAIMNLRMTHSESSGSVQQKEEMHDVITLLRKLIDENIIEPQSKMHENIKVVLSHIENEERSGMRPNLVGELTSHICEVDSFWWKFDMRFVRYNILAYNREVNRNQPVEKFVERITEANNEESD